MISGLLPKRVKKNQGVHTGKKGLGEADHLWFKKELRTITHPGRRLPGRMRSTAERQNLGGMCALFPFQPIAFQFIVQGLTGNP